MKLFLILLVIVLIAVSEGRYLSKFYMGTCPPTKGDNCIAIRECPYFDELLNNSPLPRPKEVIQMIRSHQCGFKRKTPYVCCKLKKKAIPDKTIIKTNESGDTISLLNHKNYKLLPKDICGEIKTDLRITNGQKTGLGDYPWMALIFYNSTDGIIDFRCGGTLINDRYVLTAAHCVVNQQIVGVRLGEHNVDTQPDCDKMTNYCAPPTQDFQIEQVIVHPRYDSHTYLNDIALIKLRGGANVEYENVKPICLPMDSELKSRSAVVSGWGITEDGYKSEELLQVRMPIVPFPDCKKIYAPITTSQICAGGHNGQDSCGGDSGGPLMEVADVNGSPKFVQYGIVSFGPKQCGLDGKPGVYTNVFTFMTWILDNLEEY